MFRGYCDLIKQDEISGWAVDPQQPDMPVSIVISINGSPAKSIVCSGLRKDAVDAGIPGARAFYWNPVRSLSNGSNSIEVRFENEQLIPQGTATIHYDRENHIGAHWSETYQDNRGLLLRWWQSDEIVKHINKKVCGQPLVGLSRGLFERVRERYKARIPFERAVSVGAGDASKELVFVEMGLANRFDLFELSKYAIQTGGRNIQTAGLAERLFYRSDDPFKITEPIYDVVFWNNALHHMFDVDRAISWSWDVLKPGGIFVMDEFVGPTRMQWSDLLLAINSRLRSTLPEAYLADPLHPGSSLTTKMERPDLDSFYSIDPSECADSGRIIECVSKYFPEADIVLTGGGVYHLGLNDVLHNIITSDDHTVLRKALTIDDGCTLLGETHYAVAIAEKTPERVTAHCGETEPRAAMVVP